MFFKARYKFGEITKHWGDAKIREEYDVKIVKIYNGNDGRDLMLEVTDPDLISVTGGIVQGMSGSPIIQDGKLVGAVTHVCVNL